MRNVSACRSVYPRDRPPSEGRSAGCKEKKNMKKDECTELKGGVQASDGSDPLPKQNPTACREIRCEACLFLASIPHDIIFVHVHLVHIPSTNTLVCRLPPCFASPFMSSPSRGCRTRNHLSRMYASDQHQMTESLRDYSRDQTIGVVIAWIRHIDRSG